MKSNTTEVYVKFAGNSSGWNCGCGNIHNDFVIRCPACNRERDSSKTSDLEDQLYHATREVDEVKYTLGHKIEVLEKQNKIMRDALLECNHYNGDTSKVETIVRLCLKEIKEMERKE